MPDILQDYFEALGRLKKGQPINIPKGSRINNDNVALEAGRKKGSIKKSRPIFKGLINAIDTAAAEQSQPHDEQKAQIAALKAEVKMYRTLWEEALTREASLVKQLWNERQEWAKEKEALTGEKVASIIRKKLTNEMIKKD